MNQTCLLHSLKRQTLCKILYSAQNSANVHTKISPTAKRGILLSRMVSPAKDKAKHWHYNILDNPPKAKNVFEKVHRPSRRQTVLNSLFIKNITDVLSTGDVAPEVMGFGIEITKVKISPCCKILNVYWQVPANSFSLCEDIESKLNAKTRAIRAEIISRNLMGKVPHIFFIRDHTNARLAAFEAALKDVEAEIKEDSSIVLDEAFLEDVLAFNSARKVRHQIEEKPVVDKEPDDSHLYPPPRPSDMKCDVFGLKHDVIMDRVMAAKKKTRPSEHEFTGAESRPSEDKDLFSRISGETLENVDREKLLKQFQVERKKLRTKKKEEREDEDEALYEAQSYRDSETFMDNFEEDYYIEEEESHKH